MLQPSLLHFLLPIPHSPSSNPTVSSSATHISLPTPTPSQISLPTTSLLSPGCGLLPPAPVLPGSPSHNFTHFHVTTANGSTLHPLRAYSLSLPPTYDPNIPSSLILSFHGRGETNGDQERISNFSNPAINNDAIAVYPMGINREWSPDPSAHPHINDTAFTLSLLTHLNAKYCISPTQIYASGKSNGGAMVTLLACNPALSEMITAFAAAPLALYEGTEGTMGRECRGRGGGQLPVLEIHGGRDERIRYDGGPDKKRFGLSTVGVPAWLGGWAGRDECGVGNRTEGFQDGDGVKVEGVSLSRWKCPRGKEEEEGLVTGILSDRMEHVWPTLENSGVDGSRVILEFFERWGGKENGLVVGGERRLR